MSKIQVPFFRPALQEEEVSEVVATLRSGWLTSGPKVKRFEEEFAAAVGVNGKAQGTKSKEYGKVHAVAVNSGTAAMHLAVEALGLKPGQLVLVPTMTFAATAEVVRYQGAIPILVDCDPLTSNLDLEDAARKLEQLRSGQLPAVLAPDMTVVGLMPVHVGGLMIDIEAVRSFANRHGIWVVEDAAHAFPAAWRRAPGG